MAEVGHLSDDHVRRPRGGGAGRAGRGGGAGNDAAPRGGTRRRGLKITIENIQVSELKQKLVV